MAARDLLGELKRRPLLCDGGMGTQLIARGMKAGECGELWNIQRPADVAAVHTAYRQAGCDLLTTNTFRGTPSALAEHGLAERVDELNRAAVRAARAAAGDQAWVLGDVGPFGGFLEPVGETTPEQLRAIFARQMAAFAQAGADAVIIETMSDPNEVAVAVRAAKAVRNWPVIATYAFDQAVEGPFRTMMGATAADAMRAALDAGADIVGANCGSSLSLEDYLRLAEQLLAAAGAAPVIVQPNAGSPVTDGAGKVTYPATPADMAGMVPRFLGLGVKVIGGCCGTTPAHLQAMAAAMPR